MRQLILILSLVMIVVLSAHFAKLTRVNQQEERTLHDTPLSEFASKDEWDPGEDDITVNMSPAVSTPMADASH